MVFRLTVIRNSYFPAFNARCVGGSDRIPELLRNRHTISIYTAASTPWRPTASTNVHRRGSHANLANKFRMRWYQLSNYEDDFRCKLRIPIDWVRAWLEHTLHLTVLTSRENRLLGEQPGPIHLRDYGEMSVWGLHLRSKLLSETRKIIER